MSWLSLHIHKNRFAFITDFPVKKSNIEFENYVSEELLFRLTNTYLHGDTNIGVSMCKIFRCQLSQINECYHLKWNFSYLIKLLIKHCNM